MADIPPTIDVYPVGWLATLRRVGRCLRRGWFRRGWRMLRQEARSTARRARKGDWRAVKNSLNGYLAEHESLGRRCGTGWTERRALRDLYRHLTEEGVRRG